MADFAQWYYGLVPRLILHIGRGSIRQTFYGLSLPLLAKTLFAPWKRDEQGLDGLSLVDRVRVWGENLTSRLIGAMVRTLIIVAGSLILVLQGVLVGVGFVLWMILPFVAAAAIVQGVALLGSGT